MNSWEEAVSRQRKLPGMELLQYRPRSAFSRSGDMPLLTQIKMDSQWHGPSSDCFLKSALNERQRV